MTHRPPIAKARAGLTRLHVGIPVELHARLSEAAEDRTVHPRLLVVAALEEYLARLESDDGDRDWGRR